MKGRITLRRGQFGVLGAVAAVALAVAAGAFLLGRETGEGDEARASRDVPVEAPETLPLAEPAPTIDTSKPDWDLPYWEEWRAKPRYEQVISGIAVGPTAPEGALVCTRDTGLQLAKPGDEKGTILEITPDYLPPGGRVAAAPMDDFGFTKCDGRIAAATLTVDISAASDADERIAKGESWFIVPHGGFVNVHKRMYQPGALPGVQSDTPAAHWYGATIAGLPAAVGRPVIDEGLGEAVVLLWNKDTGVLTSIVSWNLSLADVLKFAAGVAQ